MIWGFPPIFGNIHFFTWIEIIGWGILNPCTVGEYGAYYVHTEHWGRFPKLMKHIFQLGVKHQLVTRYDIIS